MLGPCHPSGPVGTTIGLRGYSRGNLHRIAGLVAQSARLVRRSRQLARTEDRASPDALPSAHGGTEYPVWLVRRLFDRNRRRRDSIGFGGPRFLSPPHSNRHGVSVRLEPGPRRGTESATGPRIPSQFEPVSNWRTLAVHASGSGGPGNQSS